MSNILVLTDHYNYFLYEAGTDMRRSFSGLEGIVKNALKKEMNEKDVYVFLNKQLTHMKILIYEKRKYCLFYQRLHKGTFKSPATVSENGTIQLMANELLMMIRGIHLGETKK